MKSKNIPNENIGGENPVASAKAIKYTTAAGVDNGRMEDASGRGRHSRRHRSHRTSKRRACGGSELVEDNNGSEIEDAPGRGRNMRRHRRSGIRRRHRRTRTYRRRRIGQDGGPPRLSDRRRPVRDRGGQRRRVRWQAKPISHL